MMSASKMSSSLSTFTSHQSGLLSLEREAELSSSSLTSETRLERVKTIDISSDVLGKTAIKIGKDITEKLLLPPHNITIGDVVELKSQVGQEVVGVVAKMTNTSMVVMVEQRDIEDYSPLLNQAVTVIKVANDVTYRRLKRALSRLEEGEKGNNLVQLLFADDEDFSWRLGVPHQSLPLSIVDQDGNITFRNKNLNDSQREAIEFALKQKQLAIVHGPPGTGKTTTLVELVHLFVRSGLKVLCCAPSNVAVDNFMEKLVNTDMNTERNKLQVVRLGHPVRINEVLRNHALDALIAQHEQTVLAKDVRREISDQLSKLSARGCDRVARQNIKKELKLLRKELIDRERRSMKEILRNSDVVMATLTSSSIDDSPLKHTVNQFDVVVIDECSQSIELACWIALTQAPKAVLAGDHKQLPPTVISEEAAQQGLNLSLMERLLEKFQHNQVVRMLTTQYRMNSLIMEWSNNHFYDGLLQAHHSVAKRLLCHINGVQTNDDTETPLVLIDTSHCEMSELCSPDGSRANAFEASLVLMHVNNLLNSGVKPQDMAIISPYNMQVALIKAQLTSHPKLEVRSVDGFQGREKECVVISLVRSNPKGQIGFLEDLRRLNVAITRAKRQVTIIGDMQTLCKDKRLRRFVDFVTDNADSRSADQYRDQIDDMDLTWPEGMQDAVYNDGSNDVPSCSIPKVKSEGSTKVEKREKKKAKGTSRKPSERKDDQLEELGRSLPKASEPHVENGEELRRSRFKSQLESFLETRSQNTLTFDSSLTSFDRMLLHQLAEELGLKHESLGEGKKRQLVISKQRERSKLQEESEGGVNKGSEPKFEEKENVNICPTCNIDVPKENLELHTLRCPSATTSIRNGGVTSGDRGATMNKSAKTKQKSRLDPKSKSDKKSKTMKSRKSTDLPDDDDELLNHFQSLNQLCRFEKCAQKVETLGITCNHCKARFCLSHSMPEIHGCGVEARKEARHVFVNGGSSLLTNSNSGRIKHAQLQHKLDARIKNFEQERKSKEKKKK